MKTARRILIFLGHPSADSLCGVLADAYAEEAAKAGQEVRLIRLGDLDYDPVLHEGYVRIQPLESCLQAAQADILWAQHLVFVYPTWWGGVARAAQGFFRPCFFARFCLQISRQFTMVG